MKIKLSCLDTQRNIVPKVHKQIVKPNREISSPSHHQIFAKNTDYSPTIDSTPLVKRQKKKLLNKIGKKPVEEKGMKIKDYLYNLFAQVSGLCQGTKHICMQILTKLEIQGNNDECFLKIAAAIFMVSCKFNEVGLLSSKQLVEWSGMAFTVRELVEVEAYLLIELEYRVPVNHKKFQRDFR